MTSANSLIPYSESGHGDPVILLDWTPWETPTLANAFATRYRVINIVPPDSGRSAGSARDAAAAIADVANATGLDSYILIGVSLGANVAFRLALLNPDSVAALVLVSPTCVASVAPKYGKHQTWRLMQCSPTRKKTPRLCRTQVVRNCWPGWQRSGLQQIATLSVCFRAYPAPH